MVIENIEYDVAVIGNSGIDTNIYLQGNEINFEIESNFTQNIDSIGQAGGYASRGYRKLSKRTAFIGYLGDDFSGHYIQTVYQQEGIDTTAVFVDPRGTARSINLMYPDGRRKNFYDGKSHMHLIPDLGLCQQILARSRLAHFNIPNWARHLLPIARQLGLVIACDIQDVGDINDPYRQDFIQYADYLFFSAANHPDPGLLLDYFHQVHPEAVLICGMGSRGCALLEKGEIRFFKPVNLEAPVIDTNGAGDLLAVGFLTSYIFDRYSLTESILRGQIAARHTCTIKADSSKLIDIEMMNNYFHALTR